MRSLFRALFALAALVAPLASTVVHAQSTNVVVLGLTSIEGDDTFATNLSGALRQAASQVRGWSVSERDLPLSQIELATGCDATELSCVQQIANTVGAQRLVYGTIQRLDAGSGRFDFQIRIHLYDTASNSVLRSLEERLPSSRSDIDDLREPARRYASSLAASTAGATSTSPGVGLPPEGHDADPAPSEPVRTPPVEGDQGGSGGGGDDIGRLNWPAFALLAVGVGTAIAWVFAGIDAQANAGTVSDFRAMNPTAAGGASDLSICNPDNVSANVPAGDRRDAINGACSSPAEILQFVFMGTAIVAGAAGIGLLAANGAITADTNSDHVQIRLRPSASLHGGSLGLELTF